MADVTDDEAPDFESAAGSAPVTFGVNVRGFKSTEDARALANAVGELIREAGRQIDLSRLDGVTVAYDYGSALAELDRGRQDIRKPEASTGEVVGIAMTPSVIRDGKIKSHIVLNAGYVSALVEPENEHFKAAVHTIVHECAHVEVTKKFDRCFPNVLLQPVKSATAQIRWDVILACWDEYAATYISAPFGRDPSDDYEQTFLVHVRETRERANDCIKKYRWHGDHMRVLREVLQHYGNLLKFSAYHLGNLDGSGVGWQERALTAEALDGHWFRPYFERLHKGLATIRENYGSWSDDQAFHAIADLHEELVLQGGVTYSEVEGPEGTGFRIDVPFTTATLPF